MRIALLHSYWYPTGGDFTYLQTITRIHSERGDVIGRFGLWSDRIESVSENDRFVVGTDFVRDGIAGRSSLQKARLALSVLRNTKVSDALSDYLSRQFKPDVVQLNSIHSTLTQSVFSALCRVPDVGVFWRVLDYKLVCPNRTFIRHENFDCRSCVDSRSFLPVVRYKCKRGKVAESFLAYLENVLVSQKRNLERVDGFLCQSAFSAEVLARFGIAQEKLHVVANPVATSVDIPPVPAGRGYVLYFGRLSAEKGVDLLIQASVDSTFDVVVVGAGPLDNELREKAVSVGASRVRFVGARWGAELDEIIAGAQVIVCPSKWNEVSPYVILQAYQRGKPVLASRVGGIPDMVECGRTGELFDRDDVHDFRLKLDAMLQDLGRYDADYIMRFVQSRHGGDRYHSDVSRIFRNCK